MNFPKTQRGDEVVNQQETSRQSKGWTMYRINQSTGIVDHLGILQREVDAEEKQKLQKLFESIRAFVKGKIKK